MVTIWEAIVVKFIILDDKYRGALECRQVRARFSGCGRGRWTPLISLFSAYPADIRATYILDQEFNVRWFWKRAMCSEDSYPHPAKFLEKFSISVANQCSVSILINMFTSTVKPSMPRDLDYREQKRFIKMRRQWYSISCSYSNVSSDNMHQLLDCLLVLWDGFCIWIWNYILTRWC